MIMLMVAFSFAALSYAQVSFGKFTMFPNSKLFGSAWKPQLAVGVADDQYLLLLRYCSPKDYASFDDESVLLIRFGNDSVVKLPLYSVETVTKDYKSEWNSAYKQYIHYYITLSPFVIEKSVLDKIVEEGEVIKKVRVSFTNGDVQDWDVDNKYQQKFTKGLTESYQQVISKDAVRKENIEDVEHGF